MKSLSSGQRFPKSKKPSRVCDSHAYCRNRAKIEVRDFMHVLVISKFHEDLIKTEIAVV